MESITSVQNRKAKDAAKLNSAKERKNTGCFLLEGIKLIKEAARSGYNLTQVFVSENANVDCISDIFTDNQILIASDAVMAKISSLCTHQNYIAIAKIKESKISINDKMMLALDNVQDPSNIGAILRSAEAFGIESVLMSNGCCDIYSPKVLRAAMGSAFRINTVHCSLEHTVPELKKAGYDIIGTGLDKNYRTVDNLHLSDKKLIIIGNEGNGISDRVKGLCDFGMYIPMSGQNESLNAAVAASIIMWENQRQNNE